VLHGFSQTNAVLMARSFEQPNGPCFPIPPAGANRQNPLATLCRQRLPFLFLLGAAVCGIAISERVHAASGTWLAAGFLSATAFFATRRVAAFGILTLCVFGTLTCGRVKNPRQSGLPDGSGTPVCRRRRAELWPANRV